MRIFHLSFSLILIFSSVFVHAQEIPVGTWRLHVSYDSIIDLDFSNDATYAATEMGIAIFDQEDGSFTSLTKLNGLTGSGITAIGADAQTHQLVIGYEDSNIDLFTEQGVISYSALRDNSGINGSKKINDINVHEALAYLSTDYGVVVFDLNAKEVKETWRDLGSSGSVTRIFNSSIFGDSIALATDQGVLIGNLNDNLLDFNFWKRFSAADFSDGVAFVQWLNGQLYCAVNNKGVYRRPINQFDQVIAESSEYNSFETSSDRLVLTTNEKVSTYSTAQGFVDVADELITGPQIARFDQTQNLWIGDASNGMVVYANGGFLSYKPNGPSAGNNFRLRYADNKIHALAGGFSSAGEPSNNNGIINIFQDGMWSNENISLNDITDVASNAAGKYISSFQNGLIQQTSGGSTTYDNTNSPLLKNESNGQVSISAIYPMSDGVWVTNYNTATPLQFLSNDKTWSPYSPPVNSSRFLTSITTDFFGNVWGAVNPSNGGGLVFFNPFNNDAKLFSETAGFGGLPDPSVLSVVTDREGYVWVGTAQGVAYFYSESADAIKPIFENRFLLKDESINRIIVDGGNRKWMATNRGVWLFNPTGEELVYNFNTSNSPLLSDVIKDIAINEKTGEVFFATEKGIASFRSDATTGAESFDIKIFPNPVTVKFSGNVGISGLATDAVVKITDISGKLVWQGTAKGGTIKWNLADYNGRRADTGVYLVFAAKPDGSDSAVGKIVIID